MQESLFKRAIGRGMAAVQVVANAMPWNSVAMELKARDLALDDIASWVSSQTNEEQAGVRERLRVLEDHGIGQAPVVAGIRRIELRWSRPSPTRVLREITVWLGGKNSVAPVGQLAREFSWPNTPASIRSCFMSQPNDSVVFLMATHSSEHAELPGGDQQTD